MIEHQRKLPATTNLKRVRSSRLIWLVAGLTTAPALATTYYISPTGSDSNSGTSSTAPWDSVAKVDSTNFAPGDQILFQYGSTWNAGLDPTTSGTVSAPIVYGAYGNPALGNPTFSGSNPVNASAFTPVSGTTYSSTPSSPVNWVYDNNQFTREAQDALTQAGSSNANDPATDLSFVESTPGSFYYNATTNQLYVNTGKALSGNEISEGIRQDAIYVDTKSNLVIENLNTTQTAADQAGYGIRTGNSSNIYLLNSTASLAGKHNVGVINTTGFVGTNLVSNGEAPDQGFGGASAFVAYSDANPARANNQNNTSVWNNITSLNPDGPYEVFISHGDPGAIASVAVNNAVSLNGYGTGIDIEPSGPNEVATVEGGNFSGAVSVGTNNSIVNGATVAGQSGSIVITGTHDVVQNNVLMGNQPYLYAGRNGAIIDDGTNNTIRFNVIDLGSIGPGIGLENQNGATSIYGNIIRFENAQNPTVAIGQFYSGAGNFNSDYNVQTNDSIFFLQTNYNYLSMAQWQSLGYDVHSLTSDPMYTDRPDGNYTLQADSPALGLYPLALDSSQPIANSLVGAPYTNGGYNAGLNNVISANLNLLAGSLMLTNGQTNVVTPNGNTLTISSAGALLVASGTTLDLAGNVSNAGSFAAIGSLLQTGNFTNTGTAIFAGSQIWSPGTTYTNASGTTTFQHDVGGDIAPAEYLSVIATGGNIIFASNQHLVSLNISTGATVQLTSNSSSGRVVVFTPSLSVTGQLDLGGNDLEVQGGNLAAITALVKQGYNGGKWNGSGIISTTAANDTSHLTTIGVIMNSTLYGSGTTLGLFDGTNPDVNDVLVRYTYYGDANLDGTVDGSDYSRIDNGFLSQLSGWFNGDFNYDGAIDGSDYTLIDNAFNSQGSVLSSSIVNPTAQVTAEIAANFGEPSRAVPEPASLGLLSLLAPLFLRQRCRVQQGHATVQKAP